MPRKKIKEINIKLPISYLKDIKELITKIERFHSESDVIKEALKLYIPILKRRLKPPIRKYITT
ncbi:MAG: hypothetical protein ACTSRP_15705 [Candidatus Helarchaeota archaeon]